MTHLQQADLDDLIDRLRALKTRVVEEIQDANAEVAASMEQASDEVFDQAETAEAHRFGELRLSEIDIDRATLTEIEQAEARLAKGGYGLCIECNDPIPLERLLAKPATLRCIDCQNSVEQQQRV